MENHCRPICIWKIGASGFEGSCINLSALVLTWKNMLIALIWHKRELL
ncbi:mCG1040535 [Mus musculus]|nr:mCG1040535 [Mus musculus]